MAKARKHIQVEIMYHEAHSPRVVGQAMGFDDTIQRFTRASACAGVISMGSMMKK
jgi:hypothetical protein